jgi:poly(A) polymerase
VPSARRHEPRSIRDEAARIAAKLRRSGFEAFFAGGCVRDRLLGLEPREYDIATDATPEQVKAVFPRAIGVGEAFGVMLLRSGGTAFEIATFRTDGTYRDGRHPEAVRFAGAKEDASRRDFTINGLFEDPADGRVLDFVGGEEDLRHRLLRAIGDPASRLAEDRLRSLRAVRFAARYGLSVDPATAAAIESLRGDLRGVSRERLGQELRKLLGHASRARAVQLCEAWGLDAALLGEASGGGGGREARHPRVAGLGDEADAMTGLAAWSLDRGWRGEPAALAASLQGRLGLSNRERDQLEAVLAVERMLRESWDDLGLARRRRVAADRAFEAAIGILAGDDSSRAAEIRAAVAAFPGGGRSLPERWLGGNDLLAAGVAPGRRFGEILEQVFDAQLEGRVATPEQAMRLASDLAAAGRGGRSCEGGGEGRGDSASPPVDSRGER